MLIDAGLLRRALLVLGLTEAACALIAFVAVLSSSGWHWGTVPTAGTLAMASGATFAAIALGQMANAFACRSDTVPVWRLAIRGNLFVVVAVAAELLL